MEIKKYIKSLKLSWEMKENKKIKSVDKKNLKKFSELMLVVGGDGSLLHGAKIAVDQNLPVLGINRGYLGFLADIHPNDKKTLKQIIKEKINMFDSQRSKNLDPDC